MRTWGGGPSDGAKSVSVIPFAAGLAAFAIEFKPVSFTVYVKSTGPTCGLGEGLDRTRQASNGVGWPIPTTL